MKTYLMFHLEEWNKCRNPKNKIYSFIHKCYFRTRKIIQKYVKIINITEKMNNLEHLLVSAT
jgi:hypothetical protein